jgi:transposase
MTHKRYLVTLNEDERQALRQQLRRGKQSVREQTRARILLLADEGASDAAIARGLHSSASTVQRTRQRYVEGGLEAALKERRRVGGQPKLNARQEAVLVALACSEAPGGRARWTMQLLAEKLVALGTVESISDETVRRVLKKTHSSRGSSSNGAYRR